MVDSSIHAPISNPSATPVVSADWLQANLNNPLIRVVDCRFTLMQPQQGRLDYETGHIPGAAYLDLNQDLSGPVQARGGRHPLPDISTLAQKLGAIGIQSHPSPTFVVAYDDSRFAFAARLWWLLHYLGHKSVAILDGGFSSWQQQAYPVTTALPQFASKTFVPQVNPDLVVHYDDVQAALEQPDTVLIDSREGDRYRGEREPIDPVAGHIPGAHNYCWTDITNGEGKIKPIDFHRKQWSTFQNAEQLIVYCGSGVTACVNLLSLELAGIHSGQLYAGSWSDWCTNPKTLTSKETIARQNISVNK
jgi:thiosulfate/3-mercaptopyruvate sulfurtransferase